MGYALGCTLRYKKSLKKKKLTWKGLITFRPITNLHSGYKSVCVCLYVVKSALVVKFMTPLAAIRVVSR